MKTKLLLSLLLSFYFYLMCSQVPQGFTYQAIARDGANPVTTPVSVMLTVQSTDVGGTTFWIELHTGVQPNASGQFSLIVGNGVKQPGSTVNAFGDIDWTVSPKYLKTQIDIGSGLVTMGTSQLVSVPYSLVAESLAGPVKKLGVTGTTTNMDEALFEVKNKTGQTVFAVYSEGVRIYVDDGDAKGIKGGFAIGGFGTVKAPSQNYFVVKPDTIRMYIDDTPGKGVKGGFAIGGFGTAKAASKHLFVVNPDSIRAYIDTNPGKGVKGGFAIGSFGTAKAPGEEYLRVTRDSTRVNVNEAAKGIKGGFAIGSFNQVKGSRTPFTSLTPDNYFIGHEAGMSNTTGLYNSFFGYNAGRSNTSGGFNTFIGHKSGYSNQDGIANLFIGDSAGYENTSGYSNVSLGTWAGQWNKTGRYNVLIGTNAGLHNITGNQNVNIGMQAGQENTYGSYNTLIGTAAGQNATGGSNNVFLGNISGYGVISGDNNVYLGSYAGKNSTYGSWNVFIGYGAGRDETNSHRLYIANYATPSPLIYGEFDNAMVVINGNSGDNYFGDTFFVNGTAGGKSSWYNDSDKKLKHDIITIPDALQKVLQLRGVNFLWNKMEKGMEGLQMGFIGQEAAEVIPEVVSVNNDHFSMQYAPITALLVEAVKEQQTQIESYKLKIKALQEKIVQIESQQKEIDELKGLVKTLMANHVAQGNK